MPLEGRGETREEEKQMNLNLQQEKEIDQKLLNDFIRYWSMRKSRPLSTGSFVEVIKDPTLWIRLIESNHLFREKYGEDLANNLIKEIEHSD